MTKRHFGLIFYSFFFFCVIAAKKKVDRFIREAFDAAQPEEPAAAAVKGEKKRVFQADEDDELPAPKMVKKTPAQSSAEI